MKKSSSSMDATRKRLLWAALLTLLLLALVATSYYTKKSTEKSEPSPTATPSATSSPTPTALAPTATPEKKVQDAGYVAIEEVGTKSTFYKVDSQQVKTKLFTITLQHEDFHATGTISPDGATLIYTDADFNLQKYDIASGKTTLLKAAVSDENNVGKNIAFTEPLYSPDGKNVLMRTIGWEWSGVSIIGADGQNYKAVSSGRSENTYAWSPDSKRFVIGGSHNDLGGETAALYIASTDKPSEGKHILPKNDTAVELDQYKDVYSPQWSPDGTKIAFGYRYLDYGVDRKNAENADKYRGIYVINTDGTGFKQVTDNQSFSDSPIWKDNDTLYYSLSTHVANKSKGIFSIDIDGKNNTEIYSVALRDYRLISLSPGGTNLLYMAGERSDTDGFAGDYLVLDTATKKSHAFLGNPAIFGGWLTK